MKAPVLRGWPSLGLEDVIMNRQKHTPLVYIFTVLMVFALGVTGGQYLHADSQGWINNSLSLKIDSKFSIKLTNESRYEEITFKDNFMKNWQAGIIYKLSKKLYVAFAYKRENEQKSTYLLHENRFTLETGWKTNLSKTISFDARFRTEIRRYEDDLAENHLRFRLRLRFKSKFKLGVLTIKPFVAIEPFGDTKNDEINRYRFYIGGAIPLGKHVDFVVNYVRQGTKDKETIHVLNTGVDLKF